MQDVSTKFVRAIRTSGRRKTVLRVREAFGTTVLYDDVLISDGTVTVDRSSDTRRTATVTIGSPDLVELFKTTDSHPFGMEIEILNGVVYPDDSEELVRMGIFVIEGFSWNEGGAGDFPTLELMDRSQLVHRARLSASRDFSGYRAQDVIRTVLTGVIPSANVVIEAGLPNPRLPGGSTFDDDRWEVIKTCAQAMGAEAYFDRDGSFKVTEIKNPVATIDATVWEFNTGEGYSRISGTKEGYVISRDQGILVSAQRSIDRKQTYNAVVVYGAAPNGTTSQPFAIATDNDPESPTYYEGPFGESIYRIDNQTLTTADQCARVAVAELNARLGYSRGLSFSAVGNPALDEGDYCLFTFLDGSQEVHLLDSFSYPLVGGEFTGETRSSSSRQTSSVKVTKSRVVLDKKPSVPGNFRVVATGNNGATFAWSPAAQGSNPLKSYDIFRGETSIRTVDASVTRASVGGLASGTSYAFSIQATDYAGITSERSRTVTAKTTGVTGPPLNPVKSTAEYRAVWSASYNGDGTRNTKAGSLCYQGWKDDGNGDMRSLIGFDWGNIQRDLDGAHIMSVYLTLYYRDWEVTSGGVAVIGFHNYTNNAVPTTWSDSKVFQDRIRSSGWPKKGKRHINLGVGIGQSFKSGVFRGVALGPTPDNRKMFRGIAEGAYTGTTEPVLTITYSREL